MTHDTVTLCTAAVCRSYDLDALYGAYLIVSAIALVLIGIAALIVSAIKAGVRRLRRGRQPRLHVSQVRFDVKAPMPRPQH